VCLKPDKQVFSEKELNRPIDLIRPILAKEDIQNNGVAQGKELKAKSSG